MATRDDAERTRQALLKIEFDAIDAIDVALADAFDPEQMRQMLPAIGVVVRTAMGQASELAFRDLQAVDGSLRREAFREPPPLTGQEVEADILDIFEAQLQDLPEDFEDWISNRLSPSLNLYARNQSYYTYRNGVVLNMQHGFVWVANLGDRPPPCMACVVLDGRIFLDKFMPAHPACRCFPRALEPGEAWESETGIEWFSALDASEQRRMMGPSKFAAWQSGQFGLDELAYFDGKFFRVPSLATLQS